MTRWFRFYDEALNDPKVQKLPGEYFKAWVNILCLASKTNGELPPLQDLAFALRISDDMADATVLRLIQAGLLDEENGVLKPHRWHERQYLDATNAQRQARYRERQKKQMVSKRVTPSNALHNVTVTSQDTDTDTETDIVANATIAHASADQEFDEFWKLWPHKVGKPAAKAKFKVARKSDDLETILDGVRRYVRDKPPDRQWLNPATFLNQKRWQDEPAEICGTQPTKTRHGGPSVLDIGRKMLEELEHEQSSGNSGDHSNLVRLPDFR